MAVVDDLFDDAGVRAAFELHLGFQARRWGEAGWAFERRRLGLRRIEVAPIGFYTRLCTHAGQAEALEGLIDTARRAPLTRIRLNINPLETHAERLSSHAARQGYRLIANETHLLTLAPAMEDTRRHYHATKRSQATRPNPLASTILTAHSAAHLNDYYSAYEASLRRWGRDRPVYTRGFFEAMMASTATRIWMNYVAGRLACAMVVMSCRHYALYWQGVSQIEPDQKAAFPMVKLMDAILSDLTEAGIPWLNMGSSEGLPTVRRFKEEFGGQPRAYVSLVHEAPIWRVLNRVRALR